MRTSEPRRIGNRPYTRWRSRRSARRRTWIIKNQRGCRGRSHTWSDVVGAGWIGLPGVSGGRVAVLPSPRWRTTLAAPGARQTEISRRRAHETARRGLAVSIAVGGSGQEARDEDVVLLESAPRHVERGAGRETDRAALRGAVLELELRAPLHAIFGV